jgi:hypothetical protein
MIRWIAMEAMRLLKTLQLLEVALHRPEVRSDRDELDRLLHPEFREFGRSGRIYERAEVLAEFADRRQAYQVWAQDFRVVALSDALALLTYKSAHVTAQGELEHHTNRSSLWQLTPAGWRLLFHQGTPTQAFFKDAT